MNIATVNKTKYLKPPDIEEIKSFVKEVGVSDNQFERFYGIPENVITQVKNGYRALPSKYWHFFFEKIKPAYGVGFINEYQPNTKKRLVTNAVTSKSPEMDNHGRLGRLKTK